MNNVISYQLTNNELKKVLNFFIDYQIEKTNQYVSYQFNYENKTILIYASLKMVIQGKKLESIITLFKKQFNINLQLADKQEQAAIKWDFNKFSMIGCDEVGVGDFFGGLVTACVYLDDVDFLKAQLLNIHDSKQLTDEKILENYPILINEFKYSIATFSPNEYNEFYDQYPNNHLIKTYLHNKALTRLVSKLDDNKPYKIVMDAYVSSQKYNEYLKKLSIANPVKIDYFVEKAENKYLAVGIASMIARGLFLTQMQKINSKLEITLPLGVNYDKIYHTSFLILDKYGIETFDKLVKKHFKTYQLVLDEYSNKK